MCRLLVAIEPFFVEPIKRSTIDNKRLKVFFHHEQMYRKLLKKDTLLSLCWEIIYDTTRIAP